jgi:hypothetical protein
MADTPSGKDWLSKYPTSKSLADLKGGFASGAKKFHAALVKAGAKVSVSATFRPPERAYLMHYAFLVAKGLDPKKVPAMAGVAIDWQHKDKSGQPNPKDAVKAAKDMVGAYHIAYKPALTSRHTQGLAIDMTISWSGTLTIVDGKGKPVEITSSPRDGDNKDLQDVGASYGVIKLKSDPPHWSSDGH